MIKTIVPHVRGKPVSGKPPTGLAMARSPANEVRGRPRIRTDSVSECLGVGTSLRIRGEPI